VVAVPHQRGFSYFDFGVGLLVSISHGVVGGERFVFRTLFPEILGGFFDNFFSGRPSLIRGHPPCLWVLNLPPTVSFFPGGG